MTMWNILLLLKTCNKLDIEGIWLNTIKIFCGKPTASTAKDEALGTR